MRVASLSVLCVGLALIPQSRAQGQLAFSVVSVKPNTSGDRTMAAAPRPGGFVARNATVVYLLDFAYGLPDSRILGGPDWIRTARFDIDATYELDAGQPAPNSLGLRPAMQALMRERFGPALRRTNRV